MDFANRINGTQTQQRHHMHTSRHIILTATLILTALFTATPAAQATDWVPVFQTTFQAPLPLGSFSGCSDQDTARCAGLKAHPMYYAHWWAYPSGWPDTAKSGADGNTGAPFGGTYQPQDTVWVTRGAMHIRMFRPARGGSNHVAAVVPRLCMNMRYGKYSERFRVSRYAPGFKSAHLFYDGGYEIDYPENDWGATISAYTHPGGANFDTSASWSSWHTTSIEWTPGQVQFFLDGALAGTTTQDVPGIPMSWILQNESSIDGPYAAPGAVAQMDIAWVACYALTSGGS